MSKPVLIIGAGGHAKVLVDILRELKVTIVGLVAKDKYRKNPVFDKIPYFDSDDDVLSFDKDKVLLVNGIGSLPNLKLRAEMHQKFNQHGYSFATIVSPRAIVSKYCRLCEGVQVMPGAIINAQSVIGTATIINSGSIIDHDCNIGAHNHIAPGATLSGGINTGEGVHIGTGAAISQGLTIGNGSVIGAGSSLVKNLSDQITIFPGVHRFKAASE
ncbi:acetyltransferase [Amylibacter sp.]|nr:acetyltransferase [Amylibacter sp.]